VTFVFYSLALRPHCREINSLSSPALVVLDFILLLVLGLGNGYISIALFTWMQTRTPKEMLGRMMSITMFASYGFVLVSQAISGAVIKWNLDFLFVSAGTLVLLLTLWTVFQPALKAFSESLALQKA
jgi:hypothetical protein